MIETLTKEQIVAVEEHAEAFTMYLIQGKYKNKSEMSLYYDIVAEYWDKCYRLHCANRELGIDGLLFGMKVIEYMKRFEDCEYL